MYCLAPNQRGYARSSKPEGAQNYEIELLVADLVSFLDKKVEKGVKVTLVIHDWGSAVGFHLARHHPELVSRIVAINGPSLPGMCKNYKLNYSQIIARSV